ncbi:MAG: hypothetical protein OEW21_14015 [Betaproteobacteria bacterium]|nr:hypothetical protein [Betaproteobacteria bacterium]
MMADWKLSFYEGLSLLIALLAAVISFVSLYRTHRIAARQLELQEAQAALAKFQHDVLEKEEAAKQRADIRIAVIERGRGHRLVISNVGLGSARDVVFDVVLPNGKASFLIQSEMDDLLPITELPPGHEVSMVVAPTLGSARHFLAKIAWTSANGEHERKNLEVTL